MSLGLGARLGSRRRGKRLGGQVQLVLDQFGGAAAAFGLHRLRQGFDDTVLTVRREYPQITGDTFIGNDTITNVSTTANCEIGMQINGDGIPVDSLIQSFTADTITIDGNATGAGVLTTFTLGNESIDIGLTDAGVLDTESILSFCGAGTAAVVTYYDQSGNNRHAMQGVAIRQPRIVVDGSLITSGSKPALQFKSGGTERFLVSTFGATLQQPNSIFSVSQLVGTIAIADDIAFIDGLDTDNRHLIYKPKTSVLRSLFAGAFLAGTAVSNELIIQSSFFRTNTSENYINGTLDASGAVGPDPISGLTIGAGFNGSLGHTGNAATLLIYPDDQTANRTGIEQSLANYHGITLS